MPQRSLQTWGWISLTIHHKISFLLVFEKVAKWVGKFFLIYTSSLLIFHYYFCVPYIFNSDKFVWKIFPKILILPVFFPLVPTSHQKVPGVIFHAREKNRGKAITLVKQKKNPTHSQLSCISIGNVLPNIIGMRLQSKYLQEKCWSFLVNSRGADNKSFPKKYEMVWKGWLNESVAFESIIPKSEWNWTRNVSNWFLRVMYFCLLGKTWWNISAKTAKVINGSSFIRNK